jgi:hypothetical protein
MASKTEAASRDILPGLDPFMPVAPFMKISIEVFDFKRIHLRGYFHSPSYWLAVTNALFLVRGIIADPAAEQADDPTPGSRR